jgi:ubiquinone/menaquinone biosynthesis C-methylase UbiE
MGEAANLFTDGEGYELLMGRWSRLVGDNFIDWLSPPNGLRWLDVGCGNGAFTERLIDRCAPAAVTGIDPSAEQLAYAKARPGTKLAQFQVGDAQKLAFADGSFDAAVMALVITFVPDPAKAVMEMARVVRPGGLVATYMWDIPGGGLPMAPFYRAMRAIGIAPQQPSGAEVSRQDALRALWEKAGLQEIEARVIRISTVYASFDDFWNSNTQPIGPLGKMLSGLDSGTREQLRARLREQVVGSSNGSVSFEAFANAIKGRTPG